MTQQVHTTDEDYMRQALALGRFGLGNTAPNPAVGCVLVKDERIIGGGFTQKSRSEERRVGKECRSRWSPYH